MGTLGLTCSTGYRDNNLIPMAINNKQFLQQLRYETSASTREILQNLHQIGQLNDWAKQQQKTHRRVLMASAFTLILSLILLRIYAGLIIFPIAIMGTVYSSLQLAKYRRLSISNIRYELPKQVLAMLNRDNKGNINVDICIDFRLPTNPQKLMRSGLHPYRSGWKFQLFADRWFGLSGELCDRTRFILKITDFYRIDSGWEHADRKHKYLTQTKFKGRTVQLRFKYPQRKYGAIQLLRQDTLDAVRLPHLAQIKDLKVTDKTMTLNVKITSEEHHILYQSIVAMFLSLYQVLN